MIEERPRTQAISRPAFDPSPSPAAGDRPRAAGLRGFAWATLAVTLAVIVWGAYVRASGSGAGCGSHWPKCNGEILPRAPTLQTIVEFLHRITSGVLGAMIAMQTAWVFIALPRRHPARAGAAASAFFVLTEAAVGAALVLRSHVAGDVSMARAGWTSLHLVNTFFLVASIACTAFWIGWPRAPKLRGQGIAGALIAACALALMLTGMSGAVTALGDTLFTAPSLVRGIADDFSPHAHFLQQLRVVHPIAAMITAVLLLYARGPIAAGRGPIPARLSRLVTALVIGQIVLGVANFALAAPIAFQLAHLLVADLVWIAFVLLAAASLAAEPAPSREAPLAAGERA